MCTDSILNGLSSIRSLIVLLNSFPDMTGQSELLRVDRHSGGTQVLIYLLASLCARTQDRRQSSHQPDGSTSDAPWFRPTHVRAGSDELNLFAPPGKPDALKTYLDAKLRRAGR